ncbi:hypothetical protein ACFQAV_08540 [Companilactobacillus huachuanensis]|uniref:DUF7916 domain-containing protein n=1 Tax=Companilactobacillus huachuanensis TaxID=2559914 RepID=A0ABW1RLA8_9LACO|nr:hypothetical protein [Companilactobacillus huachuanensis]
MAHRLISATKTEIDAMSTKELKDSIRASEGRVILSQNYVGVEPLVENTLNFEVASAFGADMVFLNGYSMDSNSNLPGLHTKFVNADGSVTEKNLRVNDVKKMSHMPVGIYLECGVGDDKNTSTSIGASLVRPDRIASKENLELAVKEGVDFIVLGGNPGTGTSLDTIIEATRNAKKIIGDKAMIWAGKWEDGVNEKVLGDPLRKDSKEKIGELIDAGADVICLPMPGSRQGVVVSDIRELVNYTHSYGDGKALAMTFLDASVEGSDTDTVRECTLMSKQTGADIHAIGDAGLHGVSQPEDIYQMTITVKGRRLGWLKMASGNR